jgi:hypothetical protein
MPFRHDALKDGVIVAGGVQLNHDLGWYLREATAGLEDAARIREVVGLVEVHVNKQLGQAAQLRGPARSGLFGACRWVR